MEKPLVSVVCLCYNQKEFVSEALDSVFNQTYDNVQVVVVDDASSDGSQEVIKNYLQDKEDIPTILLDDNLGNTKAFNKGLAHARGKYVIDLACDDVLLPNRIDCQVKFFESLPDSVGVIYSDVTYIDESGLELSRHFENAKLFPYRGEVFSQLIDTYFIPPPSMMIRKSVLDELDGYDELLAYEDYDFWIRSSRNWQYEFQNESLTKVRKSKNSLSTGWYKKNDRQLHSTYLICEKITGLVRNKEERQSLIRRLKFELRQSAFSGNHDEFLLFYRLLETQTAVPVLYQLLSLLNGLRLDLSFLRNAYHRLRFGH